MSTPTTIVWFRQDLRIADQPALRRAVDRGRVIPVYIWAPEEEGDWPPGGASRWWLHHSLASLDEQLRERGSRLIIRRGPTQATLDELLEETGATAVYWNRRYEPAAIERDKQVKATLLSRGVQAESFNGSLLHEPWTIRHQARRALSGLHAILEGVPHRRRAARAVAHAARGAVAGEVAEVAAAR